MSHVLDLSGLYERRFLLRQLACGSKPFCHSEMLNKAHDRHEDGEWSTYFRRLQFLVSKYLLESAVSVRIFADSLKRDLEPDEYEEYVEQLDKDLGAGVFQVITGKVNPTLRESCNKIVHALNVSLNVSTGRDGKSGKRYSYWDGTCDVAGEGLNGKPWHVRIGVQEWCIAVDGFIELAPEGYIEFW